MAIPKYNELYSLFLFAIQDGAPHSSKDVKKTISQKLKLTTEELAERLPSQRQPTFDNRVNWAKTYLKKAGLIDSPRRGIYIITKEGLNLLASGVPITNDLLKSRYPAFSAFISGVSIAALLLLWMEHLLQLCQTLHRKLWSALIPSSTNSLQMISFPRSCSSLRHSLNSWLSI